MYDQAGDGDRENITKTQRDGAFKIVTTPVDTFRCPSRRQGLVLPKTIDGNYYANNVTNATGSPIAGRSDYAVNAGDRDIVQAGEFPSPGVGAMPANHQVAKDYKGWRWTTTGLPITLTANFDEQSNTNVLTGVSFQRSEIGVQQVSDGLSNTYLIGEKYLDMLNYETGTDGGDNETWCTGFNNDVSRCAFNVPMQDRPGVGDDRRFGSTHSAGLFMAYCDSHVELVCYDIDRNVHRGNANRADDGRPLGAP
jgi:hypothetical protein